MPDASERPYASRGGEKLAAALDAFRIDASNYICADLGANVGGFVDVLLRRGASRVYAIDTGYGVLAWRLRTDPRVVVRERTNAMHVELPEPIDLVTIDVAWTQQHHILPAARRLLKPDGKIVSLIKPHYEARKEQLREGVLPAEDVPAVIESVLAQARSIGLEPLQTLQSPLLGAKGNVEYLACFPLSPLSKGG